MWKATLAVALVAIQLMPRVGHTSPAGNPQASADHQVVDLAVEFIWTGGKELRPALRPTQLSLAMGVAPGGFHIKKRFLYIATRPIGHDTSIPWDLGRLTWMFAGKATPVTETAAPGFEVIPKETRLARLIPGLDFPAAHLYKFMVGLYDADTRNTLQLVYFDRPCHVTGTDTGNTALESAPQLDVQVDAPGWVWVEVRKTGPSTYVEDRVPSPHPVLLITPADLALFRRAQEGTH